MTSTRVRLASVAFCALTFGESAMALNDIIVRDVFGRRLNEREITVVDWEGQLANPATKVMIEPPNDAVFPASAVLTANEPRLYFDLPGNVSGSGPSKTINFQNTAAVPVLISIFPDRDGASEDHRLTISFSDANNAAALKTINVHVIDQDKSAPPLFNVRLDFSEDQTGFFADPAKRNIIKQAADDWAYFFDDMMLDAVPTGAEETFIWSASGFTSGHFRTNASTYTGFLLYPYGIDQPNPPYRSGGEPSQTGGFQASGGTLLPLRRSGGVEIEIKGNFNTLGWFLTTSDNDWWTSGNFGNEPNDLYSIAHHEIGHSLIFNPAHTRFGQFKSAGQVQDASVIAYQGSAPAVDQFDHLPGSIDRLSRYGAFGYEYYGDVPRRRWLFTKLDLLVAQAVGYHLRQTSAFIPLQIRTTALPRAASARYYSQPIDGTGGVPSYEWTIASGALPTGLTLDSFTGVISGAPAQLGTFNFTVRLRDNDATTTPVTRALSITVEATPLEITAIQRSGANILISFRTLLNHTYTLERSDSLISWAAVTSNTAGSGSVVTLQDSNAASAGRRFYRVLESP